MSIISWRCLIWPTRSRSFSGIPKVPKVRWLDWFECHMPMWQIMWFQKLCTVEFSCSWLAGMDPALPPKLVPPVQAVTFSFKQVLSNKLHITLEIKPVSSKKIPHAQQSLTFIKSTEPTCHPTEVEISDPKIKIASLLCNSGCRTDICAWSDNSIIVQGMKEKKCILLAYQEKFRAEHLDSIITKKNGKTANNQTWE